MVYGGSMASKKHAEPLLLDLEAAKQEDGSYTIRFGGDPESENYLPITKGWNYAIRTYQPREEILDGSWTFPSIKPVK